MDEQQERAILRLLLRPAPAYYMLRRAALLPEQYTRIVLHLWEWRSSESAHSWIVYYRGPEHRPSSVPLVKSIRWVAEKNESNTEPEISLGSVQEAALDQAKFRSLMDEGKQIKIPLMDFPIRGGNDGTFFGMEMLALGFDGFKLMWYSRPPEAWLPLTDWFKTMREFVSEALDPPSAFESDGEMQ
ncbi:MAG TPA: hypothetical protein VHL11_13160 [Phototrophicaceae bacterium]|jgi:hypothetical protein|nr:hypothetical protein [Phototrophicaceae bacterium]